MGISAIVLAYDNVGSNNKTPKDIFDRVCRHLVVKHFEASENDVIITKKTVKQKKIKPIFDGIQYQLI